MSVCALSLLLGTFEFPNSPSPRASFIVAYPRTSPWLLGSQSWAGVFRRAWWLKWEWPSIGSGVGMLGPQLVALLGRFRSCSLPGGSVWLGWALRVHRLTVLQFPLSAYTCDSRSEHPASCSWSWPPPGPMPSCHDGSYPSRTAINSCCVFIGRVLLIIVYHSSREVTKARVRADLNRAILFL